MKRPFTIVAIGVFAVALLFTFLQFLFAPSHVERCELKTLQVLPSTNGSVQVVLLLTNGASTSLNVIDDSFGRPFIAYETGGGMRYGITPLANNLTLYLAPGKCLTNTCTLSSAPKKFRLSCELRDTRAEMRNGIVSLFMPKSAAGRFLKKTDIPPTTTEWIEWNTVTNPTIGKP